MKATFLALAVGFVPAQALASASAWYRVEGGGVRLVTAGAADASGTIRGALEIALLPGWKTYWLDPGDAGVPPTVDVTPSMNVTGATIDYPPPHRFDDGYAVWAGYKEPVALPVTFTTAPGQPALIEADVFLGICETICIPVQARLSVDPAAAPDDLLHMTVVDAAFAALPEPARADFGVTVAGGSADKLRLQAAIPGDREGAELFIAASNGYVFGVPEASEEGSSVFFSVPVLDRPAETPQQGTLAYTLVTSAGSVSGTLPFP